MSSSYLVGLSKLNYSKNGAYWVINVAVILAFITWIILFQITMNKIEIQ